MTQTGSGPGRYATIDMVRGVAILLMIVYHFSWDLTFFGLADFRIFTNPWWIWFANIIVMMILWVMGVSQVLARKRKFDVRVFGRRFAMIAASAAAVSLATWWIDPATYVFFGILHHIVLASLVMIVAVRLPSAVLVAAGVFALAAPHLLTHPVLSVDWMLWLGLSPRPAPSVDYVPLLPWIALPLAGGLSGRWLFARDRAAFIRDWQPTSMLPRIVMYCGRHSLAIYLVHQPVL
ncbi:MAG: DUF1624 domain-containing protein, partial [Alphaproteobacteria bacterium]|nr:DUF1624 domain-containing protein [Alphaproteobacteria bacterium]